MKTLSERENREEIAARLSAVTREDARRWGRMDAHQMLCHLRDSYGLALGDITATPASGFWQRTLFKWLALSAPVRWPKNYPTRPEVAQDKGGSAPKAFAADKEALQVVFGRFCKELPVRPRPHPIFGGMTQEDWWRWGYLHADHHLRQFGR